ncbi:MAG: PorT family protein [Bacteroidales bacterium]|nr:PorT family protein [Bacteroidales bacterium]
MFEDNKYNESDLVMRSILDEGVEEVPAGVWDAVSEGLDKASRKKTVVLMWKRAAVGFGVAAALAVGLVLNHGIDEDALITTGQEDMIAVVEQTPVTDSEVDDAFETDVMVAQVREILRRNDIKHQPSVPVAVDEPAFVEEQPAPETEVQQEVAHPQENQVATDDALSYRFSEEYAPSDWEEEEEREPRKIGTSLVLSGIASTNGTNSKPGGQGMMKQPSISSAPPKTGVKETSTKSTYGIPVSFGAGVKLDLTDRWSLGAGLNYTLLTRRFYGSYIEVNDQGSIVTNTQTDIRNTQNYLGIPVNAFYNIVDSPRLNFYAYAGGAVEKCISDKYQLLGKDITHSEKVKGVQLSVNLGIGVEFLLGDYLGLYVDPSLRYYFDNGQPASIRTAQPLMLGFEMGLRVKL